MADIKHHYIEKGSGEALVLLHGNGEDSSYFQHQIDFFKDLYRVIAVDTRGHGASPRGEAPFTLEQFSLDLNDFLDDLEIDSVHLLGFSDGANIALLFALAFPNRVKSLVLNSANLFPEGLTVETLEGIGAEYETALAAGDKRQLELLELMISEPHINPSDLCTLAFPTLVIAGNQDMIEQSHTRLIAASIPGSQLEIISGSHFVAAENPSAFNKAVVSFLLAR